MKEILLAVWLTVLGISHADLSVCPCSVNKHHFLNCDSGTILKFPDDIQLEQCSINPEEVVGIELYDQPLSKLQSHAFTEFTNLRQLMLSFNKISSVAQDAFYGLTKVRNLFLSNNNITQFAKGTFDDLLSLRSIDVTHNDYLNPTYVTSAWHMCHREETMLEVEGTLVFFKDLQMSQSTDLYCDHLMDLQDYSEMCTASNTTLDCTGVEKIEDSICFLKKWDEGTAESFTNILFVFPTDPVPTEVENFFEGASNNFFQDFNSFQEPTESKLTMNQIVKNLTFYSPIFDLSELSRLTSKKTKKVTIWADTIYISAPITISYETVIRARKVSIDHKITMNITKDQMFDDSQDVEFWAMKEEYTTIKNVTMRQRKFGLLEILDEVSNTKFISSEKCNPLPKDAIEDGLDISDWFDFTHLNLMYLCAHTIQDSRSNSRLVNQIVNFTLDYTFYSTLVNNQRIYSTARKFKKLKGSNVHIVPSYSIDQVKDLAEVMHGSMQDYRVTELAQEQQLSSARGRVEDMQIQFDIIEQQQEEYFNMELIQLEAMWSATDNAWNFSFAHRNGIENSIQTAMEAMMEETFKMRENELIQMLNQAENSVHHMEDVINKYQIEIDRYNTLADASFKVQKSLFEQFGKANDTLTETFTRFKHDIDHWQAVQAAKKAFQFFSAIVNIFKGGIGWTSFPDLGTLIIDTLYDLSTIFETMEDIQKMIEEMNLGDIIDNISTNSNTDFITVLNQATDMKLMGPKFDDIEEIGRITLDSANQATNQQIGTMTEMMTALVKIATLGNRLVGEMGDFADSMLNLAERLDQIAVAKNDMERAKDQVEDIKEMIEGFEVEKEQFYSERNKTKQEYEDEINKMKEDYENMSAKLREEYKKRIMEKFESFKSTFSNITDSYNNRMSFLIESIQRKSYGLKEHSMNQRSMIMVLYQDFCDGLFFYSFGKCADDETPLISDNFNDLLDKLSNIEWDSITANDAFPQNQKPQDFDFTYVDVKDDFEGLNYPIQIFKNLSRLEINITDLDTLDGFADFWRVRINRIKLTLMDERGQPIESPGENGLSGGQIQVRITFPTIFIDNSGDKKKHSFLGHSFYCAANYWAHPDVQHNVCEVNSDFFPELYATTPNGIFTIEVKNPEEIKMQDIHSIRVWISGTYIPFLKKYNIYV